jgi:iron complex outermembrane receptor protein
MFGSARLSCLFLSAVLLLPHSAAAQQSYITGSVTDAAGLIPIAGVRVELRTVAGVAAGSAITNPGGQYRINGVQPGSYTMRFTLVGYAPVETEPFQVARGIPVIRGIQMTALNITLERIVSSISRTPEKILETPASVSVVDARTIERTPNLTIADHVRGLNGVDATTGGLYQSNIVARGFNNAFSGAMLMLVDNRFASVPSLRVNVPALFTVTSDDIERIEVVLGPAGALYGPNSANGVLAIFTKSPFESRGLSLSIEAGERGVMKGTVRAAAVLAERVGFKLSIERMVGDDFRYFDPDEPGTILRPPADGEPRVPTEVERDFSVERTAGELRVDYRFADDTEIIGSFGVTQLGSAIEITGANGAAQARNWMYDHLQFRLRHKGLFLQGFTNSSDAGNEDSLDTRGTFLLRTGNPIVDLSRISAFQVQQRWEATERQQLVFGFDYSRTDPQTRGTINGRNEDIDRMTEYGFYVHSLTRLAEKFDLVAALRSDYQSVVDDRSIVPRVGLVFKPTANQNWRLTYNRAQFTPANFAYFLDLEIQKLDPTKPQLPYFVRALGNNGGFTYRRDCAQGIQNLCMKSPFNTTPLDFVDAGGTDLWRAGINVAAPQVQAAITERTGDPNQAAAVVNFLRGLTPTDAQVGAHLQLAAPGIGFVPFTGQWGDIAALDAETYDVLELGVKQSLGARGSFTADLWYQRRHKFTGPASNITPSVFITAEALAPYLTTQLTPVLGSQQLAAEVGGLIAQNLAPVPLGTVVPDHPLADDADVRFSYYQVRDDVNLFGTDIMFEYSFMNRWWLGGTFSWVNENFFPDVFGSGVEPLSLNAPATKGSLRIGFDDEDRGVSAFVRGRYSNTFVVSSGVYQGDVPVNATMDLGASYRIPVSREMRISLQVSNVLDNRRPTFVGVPDIGRLALARFQIRY